jgi:uncharacterized protein YodC (DUF2158 family)
MPFKVGDTVCLKIGGPDMTVEAVDLRSADVLCTWLADNVPQHSRFKSLTLRKAEPRPPKLELSSLL